MNKAIYAVAYMGKSILKTGKFHCKSLATKIKSNTGGMIKKTDMSYEKAVQVLSALYPEKEINFEKPVRSKDMKYDVSVIVPVYNAELHLKDCIVSLLQQKTKYSYEVICVNDGSNDNSLKILQDLSENKKIVVLNQKNGGASKARNAGMRVARGRFFLFVDADDILPEKSIDILVNSAQKNNADIVQGNIAKCNKDGEIYHVNQYKADDLNGLLEYCNCNMSGTSWGRLYKRELWDGIDFFDGYAYEDAIVWCNVYPKCQKMVYESEMVYIFRIQDNSLFKRQNNSAKCLDAVWIIEGCVDLYEHLKLEESQEWYQMILWQLSVGIVTRISYLSNDEVLQAAFVVAKNIAEKRKYYQNCAFRGRNKDIYKKLEESFATGQYRKWIKYSELLSYANEI